MDPFRLTGRRLAITITTAPVTPSVNESVSGRPR
jgi:hypothetical protein